MRSRTPGTRARPSPTPTWDAAGSTICAQCLDLVRESGRRRRPRRVGHRSRRRRDLHARLPRGPRDERTHALGRRPVPRRRPARRSGRVVRPQHRPRRLRPLRPARRPRPLPAGPARRHAARRADQPGRAVAHRLRRRGRRHRDARVALRPRSPPTASSSSTTPTPRRARPRSRRSGPRAGIDAPIERVDGSGVWWRKTAAPAARPDRPRSRGTASRPRSCAPSSGAARRAPARAAGARAAGGHQGPLGRRRLLQHEARGGAHAALALAAYQQGIDDLDYEVIVVENGSAPDQKLGERVRAQLRTRVPLRRPRRRGDADPGRRAQPTASRSPPATRSRS